MVSFIARQCGEAGGGTPVLVAHNGVTFDFPKLLIAFERVGMQLPSECMFIDTYKLAQVSYQHSCDSPCGIRVSVYLSTLIVILATVSSSHVPIHRISIAFETARTMHRVEFDRS